MDNLLDFQLINFLVQNCSPEPEILQGLNRETHLKTIKPQMLSGHVQGRFLSLISQLISPKRILEIGTFTGYATLCLAEGLSEMGKIFTLESNPESLMIARKYFNLSPYHHKIEVLEGQALEGIQSLNEIFDLVFIDADKKSNQLYFDAIFSKVRSGGVILVDNVLWSGKVLTKEPDSKTKAIYSFNEYIRSLNGFDHMIIPLRDGIMLIRKH